MFSLDSNSTHNDLEEFHKARQSQINLYNSTALYYKNNNGKYLLYKAANAPLPSSHKDESHHPLLFIHNNDRVLALKELQGAFTVHLKKIVTSDNPVEIKDTLVNMVNETLKEPRAGVLGALPDTVNLVVEGFGANKDVMKTLAFISDNDYTTAMHAVNVMALTIGYCNHIGMNQDEVSRMGLMALLHDIGKTEIPSKILQSTGKLSKEEFTIMMSHPTLGADILRNDPEMPYGIELAALEHHEKLDGSGYPLGISDISYAGRLIGIIDCYEALTGDERPYRRAKSPVDTLSLLKGDVVSGKLDRNIFTAFCKSLI